MSLFVPSVSDPCTLQWPDSPVKHPAAPSDPQPPRKTKTTKKTDSTTKTQQSHFNNSDLTKPSWVMRMFVFLKPQNCFESEHLRNKNPPAVPLQQSAPVSSPPAHRHTAESAQFTFTSVWMKFNIFSPHLFSLSGRFSFSLPVTCCSASLGNLSQYFKWSHRAATTQLWTLFWYDELCSAEAVMSVDT